MKFALGEGASLEILKDDLTCEDIIEQKLSDVGREVCIYVSGIYCTWRSVVM